MIISKNHLVLSFESNDTVEESLMHINIYIYIDTLTHTHTHTYTYTEKERETERKRGREIHIKCIISNGCVRLFIYQKKKIMTHKNKFT